MGFTDVVMFIHVRGGAVIRRKVPAGLPDGDYRITVSVPDREEKRNNNQNAALHLFFDKVANALNAGVGHGISETLTQTGLIHSVSWSEDTVRVLMWERVIKAYLKDAGVKRLKKEDIPKIYSHLSLHLKKKYLIDVPFPYDNNLSLYFQWVAMALNEKGYGVANIIKPRTAWTGEYIKYLIWKPIQEKILGYDSTSSMLLRDISPVYDEINFMFGEMGIHVKFPSKKDKKDVG